LHTEGRYGDAAGKGRALGCPYEEAEARADDASTDAVREALGIFDSLGAAPAVARTVGRLRSLGERVARGPNRATRANPAGMTDREVEVLALVAAGLSNRELAQRLGISTKTAGHHVSHILAKLGATNRAEAAVAAARMGITVAKR
jgi:DNA-binding CsgD family transcriptional regulator